MLDIDNWWVSNTGEAAVAFFVEKKLWSSLHSQYEIFPIADQRGWSTHLR